jgi:hypothetical protein
MRRSVFYLGFLASLAGCSSLLGLRSGEVVLTPARSVFSAGETVTARLSNGSSDSIGYGACALRAERHNGSQWELAGPESVGCTMQLILLGANSERTLELRFGTPLSAGEYRLRFYYTPDIKAPDQALYSPTFIVQAN